MDGQTTAIQEAYDELSQRAFAVWVRLMMCSEEELLGRECVAKLLRYSTSQSNAILKELKRQKYIRFDRSGNPGTKTRIIVLKRALISGPNRFVKLTSIISQSFEKAREADHILSMTCSPSVDKREEQKKSIDIEENCGASEPLKKKKRGKKKTDSSKSSESQRKLDENGKPKKKKKSKKTAGDDLKTVHGLKGKNIPKSRKKVKISGELSELPNTKKNKGAVSSISNNISSIDLGKIKKKVSKRKNEQNKKRFRRKRMTIEQLDWKRIEKYKSVIDFEPSEKQRRKLIRLLDKDAKNKKRKELSENLGCEFAAIYMRYRRLVQEASGLARSFRVYKEEHKHARKAGEWCIRKEITPLELVRYWHEHVKDFANSKMKVPPLAFLASPVNIDTAICCLGEPAKEEGQKKHGFSDVGELERGLRAGLEGAGFSVKKYDDRFLLTIQKTAAAVASGSNIYVSSEMKPLVDWTVKNLY